MEIKLIQNKIIVIRNQPVLLDKDLAEMYGVETRALKQAVKRNIDRFPIDFMFQLSDEEMQNLTSQFVMSSWGGNRRSPMVFTEMGVAMLSSVLKSPTAIQINIGIMRAFVQMRSSLNSINTIVETKIGLEINKLKEYIEDVFTDFNDINEDTRVQIELINESIAELQLQNKTKKKEIRKIGF